MFLWLIFGYLATLLNCDLQRFLYSNPIWIHVFGITAFFFLFTVLDSNNKSIYLVWIKTILVYILFFMMTKSKWFFIIPVIVLLLIDQTVKKDLAFKKSLGSDIEKYEEKQKIFSNILNIIIVVLILCGTIHYIYIQKMDHKDDFSWVKFFFFNRCKRL